MALRDREWSELKRLKNLVYEQEGRILRLTADLETATRELSKARAIGQQYKDENDLYRKQAVARRKLRLNR